MYNKEICYIADAYGKLINSGVIVSRVQGENGEIIIRVKEQQKYKHRKNQESSRQITA